MFLDDRLRPSARRARWLVVRISVKSVNHRFLDLKLRMPEGFDLYDLRLRRLCAKRSTAGTWK